MHDKFVILSGIVAGCYANFHCSITSFNKYTFSVFLSLFFNLVFLTCNAQYVVLVRVIKLRAKMNESVR